MSEEKIDAPDGLLHLWHLDGNLLDVVGGTHGVAEGSITYEPGVFNRCAKLTNAANIIVDLNHTLYQYTVQAWVKCITNVAYAPIIFSRNTDQGIFFYDTYWASQGKDKGIYVSTPGGQIGWDYGTPTNWQFYTITCDGYTIKCYINGVQQSVMMTYNSVDKQLKLRADTRIGRDDYSSSRNLNGYIQQVMIWDKVLSQAEINKYYNNGKGLEL